MNVLTRLDVGLTRNAARDNPERVELVKQNGVWKISSMPSGNLWNYSWYQKP